MNQEYVEEAGEQEEENIKFRRTYCVLPRVCGHGDVIYLQIGKLESTPSP